MLNSLHTCKEIYASKNSFVINFLSLFQRFDNLTYIITGSVRACACVLLHTSMRFRIYACICGGVRAHSRVRASARGYACVRASERVSARGTCACVCTAVRVWIHERVCACVFLQVRNNSRF